MIKNMTPHKIDIVDNEGRIIKSFPSEGKIRISTNTKRCGTIEGVPLTETEFGECELPERKEGIYYIVSLLVCQAHPNRPDLLIVNETIRDEDGRIIGCQSLSRNPYYRD